MTIWNCMKSFKRSGVRTLAFSVVLASLSGAGVADVPAELSDQLKERVEARWQALIERDFEAAYQFQSPAYREVFSLQGFTSSFGGQARWISAQVMDVTLPAELTADQAKRDQAEEQVGQGGPAEEQVEQGPAEEQVEQGPAEEQAKDQQVPVAEVRVRLEYQVPFPPESPIQADTTVEETWLLVDNQWWHGEGQ